MSGALDGALYSSLCSEDERLCLLVIIGVLPNGERRFVAISDGFRESAESWKRLLRELKERGLKAGPRLAIGDGALMKRQNPKFGSLKIAQEIDLLVRLVTT